MEPVPYQYTTGNDPELQHIRLLGCGGSGHVHEVGSGLSVFTYSRVDDRYEE